MLWSCKAVVKQKVQETISLWKKWNELSVTPSISEEILKKAFNKKLAIELQGRFIQQLPDRERTVWGLYNIYTYYLTHQLRGRKQDLKELRRFCNGERFVNRLTQLYK